MVSQMFPAIFCQFIFSWQIGAQISVDKELIFESFNVYCHFLCDGIRIIMYKLNHYEHYAVEIRPFCYYFCIQIPYRRFSWAPSLWEQYRKKTSPNSKVTAVRFNSIWNTYKRTLEQYLKKNWTYTVQKSELKTSW